MFTETDRDPMEDLALGVRQAERFRVMLRTSELQVLKELPKATSLADQLERMPRWPSGLGPEFDSIHGGLQAVTAVYGPPGAGKSQFSMACSLENAIDGACVVYFDAENHGGEQRDRAVRWCGGEAQFQAQFPTLQLNLHWCHIDYRHSWGTMMRFVSERILHSHPRVLIVLDSIQSVADEIEPGNMLGVTARLYSVMNRLVRETAGRIGFLVLSEANKEGGLKGGAGGYRSSMAIKIEPDRDAGEDIYNLALVKNRTGRTPGSLGNWELKWWLCRFGKLPVS